MDFITLLEQQIQIESEKLSERQLINNITIVIRVPKYNSFFYLVLDKNNNLKFEHSIDNNIKFSSYNSKDSILHTFSEYFTKNINDTEQILISLKQN